MSEGKNLHKYSWIWVTCLMKHNKSDWNMKLFHWNLESTAWQIYSLHRFHYCPHGCRHYYRYDINNIKVKKGFAMVLEWGELSIRQCNETKSFQVYIMQFWKFTLESWKSRRSMIWPRCYLVILYDTKMGRSSNVFLQNSVFSRQYEGVINFFSGAEDWRHINQARWVRKICHSLTVSLIVDQY